MQQCHPTADLLRGCLLLLLQASLQVDLPATLVFDYPSSSAITAYVYNLLTAQQQQASGGGDTLSLRPALHTGSARGGAAGTRVVVVAGMSSGDRPWNLHR